MSFVEKLLKGAKVEWKTLGEVAELKRGKTITAKDKVDGNIPVISGGQQPAYYNAEYNREGETITVAGSGAYAGYIMYWNEPIFVSDAFSVKPNIPLLDIRYIYFFLLSNQAWIFNLKKGAGIPHVYPKDLAKLEIPIPPLSVQKEIVRILDTFTQVTAELSAELSARKKQYDYYREQLLTFDEGKVEWKTLGEVCDYEQPTKYLVKSKNYNDTYATPVLTAGKTFILGYTNEKEGIRYASKYPVIIFDDFTTANKWVDFDFKAKSSAMKIITSCNESNTLLKFIYYWLNTLPSGLVEGDHKRQWISEFSKKLIPIPPLSVQKEIVRILDTFTQVTAELSAELSARKKQYEYYREMLLTFPKEEQ